MADPQGAQGGGSERQFPPRMTRSQPQFATAYAPGAMFTWEGGKGACIAVPSTARRSIFRPVRPVATRWSRRWSNSAATGSRAACRSTAPPRSSRCSCSIPASTIPCAKAPPASTSRSTASSFCGPSAWDICPGRSSTGAITARSCANTSRPRTSSPNRCPPAAQARPMAREAGSADGGSSMSSMFTGPASWKGLSPYRNTVELGRRCPENPALPVRRDGLPALQARQSILALALQVHRLWRREGGLSER